MSTPFIGEIRMFGGNFAPVGWAFCDGSLVPISEYEALFTLIGTTYGGDGESTFALPDLCGRVPIHQGQGPGLSNRFIGEAAGAESVTLGSAQLPPHGHAVGASTAAATAAAGPSGVPASAIAAPFYAGGPPSVAMNPQAVPFEGGNQPHENMAPFLCVSYIIALFGIFPQQS